MVEQGTIDLGGGNPFEKAERIPKRLKMLLFGPTGSGKTVSALRFPRPVVLDNEHGTDLYGKSFSFDVKQSSDPDELMALAKWLAANAHNYRTVVVDGLSVYWSALQKKWSDIFLVRRKGAKGYKHEFYDLGPKDWMTLKAEWHEFIRTILDIDATIIFTARQKNKYADNQFMKVVGVAPDAERNIEHEVDVVLRLYVDETTNVHMAHVCKDRSNDLPKEDFPMNMEAFHEFDLAGASEGSEDPTQVMPAIEPPASEVAQPSKADLYRAIDKAVQDSGTTFSRVKAYWTKKHPDCSYESATVAQLMDVLDKVKGTAKE